MKFLDSFFRQGNVTLLLFSSLILVSCDDGGQKARNHYIQTLQSGMTTLPWPREMEALYGEGDHAITEYALSSGPKQWHTEVYFYGRYTLALGVYVTIDYRKHTVTGMASSPKFYLHELESVDESSGRLVANFSNQWDLDEEKWEKLVQAKGDWSVLGIPIKTNSPVPGFEDYMRKLRDPHVKIPRK